MTETGKRIAAALSLLAALLVLWPMPASAAQTASTGKAPGDAWTRLGDTPAGLSSLISDPADPSTLYSMSSGGLARSTDSGATWKPCSRGGEVRAARLVASQGQRSLLYTMGLSGLRKSGDGCQTWADVPSSGLGLPSSDIRWLAPYPNNPAVLYAGVDGLGGLYRSTDTGATWQPASSGLPPGAWVTALAADPDSPSHLYVGVRYVAHDHPPAYVFRSTDGGLTWRSGSLGVHVLPRNGGEIAGFAWAGDTIFAATAGDGLYASTDRGMSWHEATLPRPSEEDNTMRQPGAPIARPMPVRVTSLLSTSEGALVLGTTQGVYHSVDAAQSWQGFGPQDASAPAAVAVAGNRVVVAGDRGLWGAEMPSGVVSLPRPTQEAVSQALPTAAPPPLLPTNTPLPPTATPVPKRPTATPTSPPPTRPPGYLPTDRSQPLDPSIATYFEQTGHNIKQGFRDFWSANGGTRLMGYPLTEEFVEDGVTVQYFERAKLEYKDGRIAWALLGSELTKGRFFQTVRFFPSEDDKVYFGPTQHSISGPFLNFWRDNGGLNTLGYPLSESFNDDGSEYQWFERARLEWHPWFPEGNRIVLGSIGTEYLKKRGWIK